MKQDFYSRSDTKGHEKRKEGKRKEKLGFNPNPKSKTQNPKSNYPVNPANLVHPVYFFNFFSGGNFSTTGREL